LSRTASPSRAATRARLPLLPRLRAEAWALIGLAAPIIGSQLASVGAGFLDTVMAGHAGATEQAVVGLGVAIWAPVFLALMGIVQAVSPLVAHHFGAGDDRAIVHDARQGLQLAAVLGLLPALAMPFAPDLLRAFDTPEALIPQTVLFLWGTAVGMPAALMFRALGFYSASINRPTPAMVLSVAGLAVNALFNWLLIHGHAGLPRLGGAGCGWATGLSMWAQCLALAGYLAVSPAYRRWPVMAGWSRPDAAVWRRLLRLGLPMGGANLAEVAAFTGVALMISSLGATTVAAHQAALNFAALMFMLPAGLSAALSIRVSQALGSRDGPQARFVAWSGMAVGLAFALAITPVVLAARPLIAAVYSSDAAVQALIAQLLLFAAAWHWADAAQVCAVGALRGYRVTLLPMLMMVAAYWGLAIPLGAALCDHGWPALGWPPMGVRGYWVGLLVGLVAMAAAVSALLGRSASRTARLLNPRVLPGGAARADAGPPAP
jgi:MATE family multidrug resistance protein